MKWLKFMQISGVDNYLGQHCFYVHYRHETCLTWGHFAFTQTIDEIRDYLFVKWLPYVKVCLLITWCSDLKLLNSASINDLV